MMANEQFEGKQLVSWWGRDETDPCRSVVRNFFFFFFSFIWDRDAGALQSNGDICSSSSEELKRSYLHTKGFTTQKDDPLGAYEYSYTLSVNSGAPLMNVRKTCAARDVTLRQYQAIRAPLFLIWLRAMLLSLEYEFHYNNITKCYYFI